MTAHLVFLTGSKAGHAVELVDGDTTFGRGPSATVVFAPHEVLVSSRHASVHGDAGRYILRDEGSRNGTFINGHRVTEHALADGDLVQFGPGGPAARFTTAREPASPPTLDPAEMRRALEMLERTRREALGLRDTAPVDPSVATTRELATAGYLRSIRWRRQVVVLGIVLVAGVVGILLWQQRSRARLEAALADLSTALATERASRSALEQNLSAVGARYDSLRRVLENDLRRAAGNPRVDLAALREYTSGVALIAFAYGYGQGDRLLRYAVGADGAVITRRAPGGEVVPAVTLGGDGPAVRRDGTATGFVIDTAGRLVTNRHVARPWENDADLAAIRSLGFDVTGRLLDLRAYFPPGDRSAPLVVDAASDEADVALVRVVGRPPETPVLPLASSSDGARPGDDLVLIGYPTGPFNLLFRVNREERAQILRAVGDDQRRLIAELARRRLVQPLITSGSVSDVTQTEVIHTAATTVGGSGGPLIDSRRQVVAVHYAILRSPDPQDPFRTQRGVPVGFVWEILPGAVRGSVEPAAPGTAPR